MKRLLLLLVFLAGSQLIIAQQAGRFRFAMDLGAAVPRSGGIGALVNLEPAINIRDNMKVGLRVGVAALAKDVTYFTISDDYEGEISANASALATFDYYFNRGGSKVAPYVGGGFGYYSLSNVEIEDGDFDDTDGLGSLDEDFKWAPMLRAGVEIGKFRVGAEYNFIAPSDLVDDSGNSIGQVLSQYFGFTLGFYVGGGKWKGM